MFHQQDGHSDQAWARLKPAPGSFIIQVSHRMQGPKALVMLCGSPKATSKKTDWVWNSQDRKGNPYGTLVLQRWLYPLRHNVTPTPLTPSPKLLTAVGAPHQCLDSHRGTVGAPH